MPPPPPVLGHAYHAASPSWYHRRNPVHPQRQLPGGNGSNYHELPPAPP